MDAIKNNRKYVAPTLGKFLYKIALYLRYGYVHYSLIEIPEGKDLREIDRKILSQYGVTFCRMTRKRRREAGQSNVVYLRFNRAFILMATEGSHGYFCEIPHQSFATSPLHYGGYSIGIKGNKPHVQIAPRRFKAIKQQVDGLTLHNEEKVKAYFRRISPFKFAGVSQQKFKLMKQTNQRRKVAGLPRLKWEEIKRWQMTSSTVRQQKRSLSNK